MDQELADTAASVPSRRCGCSALIRWQHFSAWNDVMAASLEVWRQV